MKKRILVMGMAVLLTLSLSFVTGCSDSDSGGEAPFTSPVNTVWGGDTPQNDNRGWLSLTFRDDNKVIAAFSADNSTNEWECTDYDSTTRKGTLTGAGGWLGGGAFTISADTHTLTLDSYMGYPRDFKRLRSPEKVVEAVPFTPYTLPTNLLDSVWAGENPMGAWVTIHFKASGYVVCSFSNDNTTNLWTFTYTPSTKEGEIISGGGFSPGEFQINSKATIMSFLNYGSHGPRDFKRYR